MNKKMSMDIHKIRLNNYNNIILTIIIIKIHLSSFDIQLQYELCRGYAPCICCHHSRDSCISPEKTVKCLRFIYFILQSKLKENYRSYFISQFVCVL